MKQVKPKKQTKPKVKSCKIDYREAAETGHFCKDRECTMCKYWKY